eukprot:6088153-Pleurochrysis_carterae.AAC.1
MTTADNNAAEGMLATIAACRSVRRRHHRQHRHSPPRPPAPRPTCCRGTRETAAQNRSFGLKLRRTKHWDANSLLLDFLPQLA